MADTEFKYDVFISYSHKDEDWADKILRQWLDDTGLKVCIDYRDFEAGKMALLNMQDAAMQSKHVLLVLTRNWLSSEWSFFEALMGGTQDPSGLQKKLIPLLCEGGIQSDINSFIAARTWVDFTRKDRESVAWKQLFTALGKPDAKIPVASQGETAENTPASWFLAHPYGMAPNFTGRQIERAMLTEWLTRDPNHPMLILRALGGFGKSALTWYWLTHDVPARQFIKVVFWSFYEGDASFDNFVRETLQYLGALNAGQLSQYEQTNLLLKYLRNPGILLILDGFERVLRAYGSMGAAYQGDELQQDDSQDASRDCINMLADSLLRSIGAYGGMLQGKILMTTRLTPRAVEKYGQLLQGIHDEELSAMNKEDAVEFFHTQGIRGTRAEIRAACEPYGYHPLSLRILSGYIVNDRNLPGDIAAANHLEITEDIIQNKHHILDVGFNSLSAAQKKLLGRIACFRTAMDYEALKTLHGDGKGSLPFDSSLKILESRGFLHWDRKTNKYDLHPIVRRFAYNQLTAADRTGAHERLVNYFEAVPKPEKVTTLDDLAAVIELYHHMVSARNWDEAIKLFRDRIAKQVYYQFGAYQLCIELMRALFLDGEDKLTHLEDETLQAWALNTLANAYSMSGQPRRAVPLFEMHNVIYEKAGDKKNLAIGLVNLASMAQIRINALRAAERNLRRSIDLSRGIADEYIEAVGHQELGRVLSYCGMWQEAEQEFHNSLVLAERVEHVQMQGVNWSYRALRFLLIARSDPQSSTVNLKSSIECAHRAIELADEAAKTNAPTLSDYVHAHWLLGATYRSNNDLILAQGNLSKALNLCRQINMVDYEADILLDLARLRDAQGDFKDAHEKASDALLITERCGYVLQGADVNLFLAELAVKGYKLESEKGMSNKEAALLHARRAKELAYCDGPPYYYKVAYEEAVEMLKRLNV